MRTWIGRHRLLSAAVVASAVVTAVGVATQLASEAPPPPDDAPAPELVRLPLTGELVETAPRRPALLVKVSNAPEARPQTGLERADVVLEELTEGGITRFIAVFHSTLPDIVGPVRSARPVDLQVAGGFGRPGLAYSGARAEVRTMLQAASVVGISEGHPAFFRDDGTYASHPVAPHDLFVRAADASRAVEAAGAAPLADLGWVFADAPPPGGVEADAVDVAMSGVYRTGWRFDAVAGVYRRTQNGEPSLVTGPGRIGAANVVVLRTRHYTGASGYPETDVLGEGPAVVLRDGRRYAARWSKPRASDPVVVLDAGGEPFPLKPGPTWFLLPAELPD